MAEAISFLTMAMRFYKSAKWKRKREQIFRRDGYVCRECARYGKTTEAQTVHHIYPLDRYPKLALVSENLISLCYSCHDKMHDRNTGELTEAGKYWQSRAAIKLRNRGILP